MIAVSCGHIETVDLLLRGKGIKVNERMDKGLTAMHYAVWFGFTDCASRLCKHSDIVLDMPAHDGQTPLHYAMTFGRRDIAKMLLSFENIGVNCQDSSGRTPLHCAVEAGLPECVVLLLQHPRIDVTKCTKKHGLTPQTMAKLMDRKDIAKLFESSYKE